MYIFGGFPDLALVEFHANGIPIKWGLGLLGIYNFGLQLECATVVGNSSANNCSISSNAALVFFFSISFQSTKVNKNSGLPYTHWEKSTCPRIDDLFLKFFKIVTLIFFYI